jgi:hypothetical protein
MCDACLSKWFTWDECECGLPNGMCWIVERKNQHLFIAQLVERGTVIWQLSSIPRSCVRLALKRALFLPFDELEFIGIAFFLLNIHRDPRKTRDFA